MEENSKKITLFTKYNSEKANIPTILNLWILYTANADLKYFNNEITGWFLANKNLRLSIFKKMAQRFISSLNTQTSNSLKWPTTSVTKKWPKMRFKSRRRLIGFSMGYSCEKYAYMLENIRKFFVHILFDMINCLLHRKCQRFTGFIFAEFLEK